jgi:hypothetical protein
MEPCPDRASRLPDRAAAVQGRARNGGGGKDEKLSAVIVAPEDEPESATLRRRGGIHRFGAPTIVAAAVAKDAAGEDHERLVRGAEVDVQTAAVEHIGENARERRRIVTVELELDQRSARRRPRGFLLWRKLRRTAASDPPHRQRNAIEGCAEADALPDDRAAGHRNCVS